MHTASCETCGAVISEACTFVVETEGNKETTSCTVCGYVSSVIETIENVEEILNVIQPTADAHAAAPAPVAEALQTIVQEAVSEESLLAGSVTITTAAVENAEITLDEQHDARISVTQQVVTLPDASVAVCVLSVSLDEVTNADLHTSATLRLPCAPETAAALAGMKLVFVHPDGSMEEIEFEIVMGEIVFKIDAPGTFAFIPANMAIN